MKKILAIVVFGLFLSGNVFAQQISCEGENTPDARFIVSDDTITLSESGGSMTFDKNWGMSKHIHKGKIKTKWGGDKQILTVQIDLKRGEAQVVTTTYFDTKDVYVRNYRNCK